jgi:hypothetical protein
MSQLLSSILSSSLEDTRAQLQAHFQHYEKLANVQQVEAEAENLQKKLEDDSKNPFRVKAAFLV